jgi:hypothetical protein
MLLASGEPGPEAFASAIARASKRADRGPELEEGDTR